MSTLLSICFKACVFALLAISSTFSYAVCLSDNDKSHPCRHTAAGDKWCRNNGKPPYSYHDECVRSNPGLAPPGTRWLQLASKSTVADANAVVQEHSPIGLDLHVFEAENGYLAIVAGPIAISEMDSTIRTLKSRGSIPSDALYALGKSYKSGHDSVRSEVARASSPSPPAATSHINMATILSGSVSSKDKGAVFYSQNFIAGMQQECGSLPSAAANVALGKIRVDILMTTLDTYATVLSGTPLTKRWGRDVAIALNDPDQALKDYGPVYANAVSDIHYYLRTYGCNSVPTIAALERTASIILSE
jgi:hypothetical protein